MFLKRGKIEAALLIIVVCVSPLAMAAQNNRTPLEYITIHGTFRVPRLFAPIDVWKTWNIEPRRTNYFLARVPAKLLHVHHDDYATNLNFVVQDMILVIEALTATRREKVSGQTDPVCIMADHDLESRSRPYRRCEYRVIFGDRFAVRFWLNGDNIAQLDEVREIVRRLLSEWMVLE